MKKIAMFIAAAAIAVSASAQKTAVTSIKALDNVYVGGALGAETKASKQKQGAFASFNPTATILVGKNFTPVFGLRAEGVARFNVHSTEDKCGWVNRIPGSKKVVAGLDVNLLGTFNLNNAIAGYKGEPRALEFIALYGFGWSHGFYGNHTNAINSKAGLEIAYNFGSKKQWQAFIEPSITWAMQGYNGIPSVVNPRTGATVKEYQTIGSATPFQYNLNRANLDLKAGIIYKLPCSNGTHNFAIEQLRDQAEIDALNAQINGLRGDVDAANNAGAQKDAQIAQLKKALADCENKPVVEAKVANLQPTVVFRQGKSVIDKSQEANVEMIAKYMQNNKDAKVKISGYASPEGPADLNQKLSEQRAAAVKDMLVKKYKIAADRLEAEGFGATDKLFDEVEFNRVAIFNDTTK
jgi:outer membrane protein OmpA-like peptidoglycan-associated protein